jgi:uncharacterized protein (TIGR03435 family)
MRLGPGFGPGLGPALFLVAVLSFAQEKPSFDVASIKPNPDGSGSFSADIAPDGRVTFRNFNVWNLIRFAYGLRDLQMSGGPAWIKSRGFDIQAQPAPSATPVPRDQTLRMLQTLLEDRFHLKWHRESPEGPAYALTIARGGPKLPPAREGRRRTMLGDLDAPSMTLDSLSQILEFELGRPVFNRTSLSGPFAIQLQWASERAPATSPPDPSPPSLFTAIQERLGLKLEPIRTPVDSFMIDNVDAPSEN